mmetsp:Transcript_904/g.1149  ORF Transcript_904/g.1149 Transcript_904/m.1149 type:complete len:107 (-) Transcript_904:158-478(-)
MTNAPAKKWVPYGGGYDPRNRAASAPQPLSNSEVEIYASSSTKNGGGWKPPTGYGSETLSRGQSQPTNAGSAPAYTAAPVADAMTSAPAKKWVPYGGYTPRAANSY